MGVRHWIETTSLIVGLTALLFVVLFIGPREAKACDSCNAAFLEHALKDHMDSPRARHILAAGQNQKGLPLDGLSTRQSASEKVLEPFLIAQAQAKESRTSSTNKAPAQGGAFDPTPILKRDAKLPIPATSFVDQSIKADRILEIELSEGQTYIGNGVVYDGFLTNGSIPGPTLRAKEGEVIEFRVKNTGTVPHGASVHSIYSQSSKHLGSIQPGETKSLKFRATVPGVYMYHCAPGGHAIPMHVLAGQYGMIIVEPKQKYKLEKMLGHGPDVELFLLQHELYASGRDAVEGNAAYTMFNGQLFRYVEEPIRARPGDYVRINFLNVGPNLLSTFHIVGIIWDFAYWQGHPAEVMRNGQTVTAGPSDSFVIEFRIPPEEGAYTMLSHAVGSTSRGAIGLIVADKNAPKRNEPILADGPKFSEEEMKKLKADAVRTISPHKPGSREIERPVKHKDPNDEAVVYIIGNSYSPEVLEVPVGTTVTWINEDAFAYLAGEFSGVHNVVMIDGPEAFVSPMLSHGESWSYTFKKAGTYDYMCAPHPYMRGRIIVKDVKRGARSAAVLNGWAGITVLFTMIGLGALTLFIKQRGHGRITVSDK